MTNPFFRAAGVLVASVLFLSGCAAQEETLTIYSGREEGLIQPLVDEFVAETGIQVEVRYGSTAELAAQILEEGDNSPAHVYLGQDAGALGALSKGGRLEVLPTEITSLVRPEFSDQDGRWVGVSGRARVLVYNPELITELPWSVLQLAEPKWQGLIAIAPANASFQSFVTAMRVIEGESVAADWLAGMKLNAVIYEKNSAILEAVESGQIAMGLINHYYWHAMARERGVESMRSQLLTFQPGDVGNLMNVAGAAVLRGQAGGAGVDTNAERFVQFLLSSSAQRYFVNVTSEYSMTTIVGNEFDGDNFLYYFENRAPSLNLSDLDSIQQTLQLIRESGLL